MKTRLSGGSQSVLQFQQTLTLVSQSITGPCFLSKSIYLSSAAILISSLKLNVLQQAEVKIPLLLSRVMSILQAPSDLAQNPEFSRLNCST